MQGNQTKTITLDGFTNLDKMVVLLDGSGYTSFSGGDTAAAAAPSPSIKSLSLTELVLIIPRFYTSNSNGGVSYQVIEFN